MRVLELGPQVYVSGQLFEHDVRLLAKQGIRSILKNRHDGEAPGQPSSADLAKVAEELGGTVTKSPPLTRTTIPQGLTQAAVTQAFLLPVNGVNSAATDNEKSRAVFRVTEIKKAEKLSDEDRKGLSEELQRELQRDQLSEYVNAVQNQVGVSVNEGQFLRATGATTQ